MFYVVSAVPKLEKTRKCSNLPPPGGPAQARNLPREKTESGVWKSRCCNVAAPALLRLSVGPVVPQAVFRSLPFAVRWLKLIVACIRWPLGGSSGCPMVACGPVLVEAIFWWLPLAPRWYKLFPGAYLGLAHVSPSWPQVGPKWPQVCPKFAKTEARDDEVEL